jgi:hypothetical protein
MSVLSASICPISCFFSQTRLLNGILWMGYCEICTKSWAVFITSTLCEAETSILEVSEKQLIFRYDARDHFKI